jgi:hypothetical protein
MYSLYGTNKWKNRRRHQLQIQPLCEFCLRENRGPVPARVADHVVPWNGDVNKFWLGELQSLCTHCHESRKKFRERHGYDRGCGPDGLPLDPRHPVYTGVVK